MNIYGSHCSLADFDQIDLFVSTKRAGTHPQMNKYIFQEITAREMNEINRNRLKIGEAGIELEKALS